MPPISALREACFPSVHREGAGLRGRGGDVQGGHGVELGGGGKDSTKREHDNHHSMKYEDKYYKKTWCRIHLCFQLGFGSAYCGLSMQQCKDMGINADKGLGLYTVCSGGLVFSPNGLLKLVFKKETGQINVSMGVPQVLPGFWRSHMRRGRV